jgi:NADPH:quinone reductase-like Zn-dependent oxidoreductase
MSGERMKAARRDRYGPPEVVRIEDVEKPVPSGDEVLVRVHAVSVNRADLDGLYPRWAFIRLFAGLRKPKSHSVGLDVAGVVESVGSAVTRFRPGDEVFADLFLYGNAAFAEYVVAPQKAFASIPAGMPFDDAATLPHSAVLALQGLRLRNGRTIRPGDRVLIVGASGNVGPFAVQVAKSLGAEVTAVDRGDKLDLPRSLGADHVIDYTKVDATRNGGLYDWILDVDAHHSIFRWRGALRPNGVYITLGGPLSTIFVAGLLGMLISLAGGKWTGMLLWWKPFHAPDVDRLKALYAEGKLRPAIDRRFPLSEVVGALRWVDDGHATGKVVITV